MDKIKLIPDIYSNKVAAIHFTSLYKTVGEHKLSGGVVPVFLPVKIFVMGPPLKLPVWYTDLCSCPVALKAKCHLTLTLITCQN